MAFEVYYRVYENNSLAINWTRYGWIEDNERFYYKDALLEAGYSTSQFVSGEYSHDLDSGSFTNLNSHILGAASITSLSMTYYVSTVTYCNVTISAVNYWTGAEIDTEGPYSVEWGETFYPYNKAQNTYSINGITYRQDTNNTTGTGQTSSSSSLIKSDKTITWYYYCKRSEARHYLLDSPSDTSPTLQTTTYQYHNYNYSGSAQYYYTVSITGYTHYRSEGTQTAYLPNETVSNYGKLYYIPKYKIIVKYVNKNTNAEIATSETKYYTSSSSVTSSNLGKSITGYTINQYSSSTITPTTSGATLTIYYTPNSYSVAYNLNGATGTISSTTRYYNTSYTLTSTHPRWTGYEFLGWKLNNSGTLYSPGATISASTSTSTLTYYAQWQIKTYTITYDANGGSGAPSQSTSEYDTYHTVTSVIPSRQNYNFLGWSKNSSDTEPTYHAGDSIFIEEDLTLYAIWAKAKDPFYWTGSSSISLQQGELINNYINSTKINEFQTKITNEINSSYSPSDITSTTLITKVFYNTLATILNISQIFDNEKITAQHWINLQDAYNNYN